MAIDGFGLDVADTAANLATFGRSGSGPKASAFCEGAPWSQMTECATHAVVAAALGGVRSDERALGAGVLDHLEPGMMLLADRNFSSYQLWRQALATGADLLWRVSATVTLPVVEPLADGSYRSLALNPQVRGKRRATLIELAKAGVPLPEADASAVRVVEYEVPNRSGSGTGEIICLITSVLDPADIPAVELAAGYHQRWEAELGYDEKKTHQRGPARVLRSKSPELVEQEIWALLLCHYAVRRLMCQAADEADADPDRLSFIRALRVIRRQVTSQAAFSP